MSSWYRIQTADRDPQDLIGTHHVSRPWAGWVECDCQLEPDCPRCGGTGQEHGERSGVSVCASLSDLARYFRERDFEADDFGGHVLIELRGEPSDDEDIDARHAAYLVHPTEIVSVRPLDPGEINPRWAAECAA